MIVGKDDTYFTVEEFAEMIGRSPNTVRNWASSGKIRFVHLCGVPLIALTTIENLILDTVPAGASDGRLARRAMGYESS